MFIVEVTTFMVSSMRKASNLSMTFGACDSMPFGMNLRTPQGLPVAT